MDSQVVVLVAAAALVIAALLLMRLRDRSHGTDAAAETSAPASPLPETATQSVARSTSPPAPDCTSQRTARLGRTPFAVVDVETTGFNPVPGGAHRIVEVAIVRVSPDGRVEDEFVTLVNPQRPMGASHIHGIKAKDVANAPTFAQIAGDVAARVSDAIVVAHNAPFDLKFLRGEFAHAGIEMPELPTLCTLSLAYRFADVSCRKLGFLCEEYGIPIDAHSALGDARAVSQLAMRLLADAKRSGADGLGIDGSPLPGREWCRMSPSRLSVVRGSRPDEKRDPVDMLFAKRATKRDVALAEHRYLEALELALGDGELSTHESAQLASLALSQGLSASDMHGRFVQSLIEGANADGTVTVDEIQHINRIARLLGVSDADVQRMLAQVAPRRPVNRIAAGTSVCLLGAFEGNLFTRVFTAATQANLALRKNITKTVGVVVVETEVAEARRQERAKALGIPVVTAAEFLKLVEGPAARA